MTNSRQRTRLTATLVILGYFLLSGNGVTSMSASPSSESGASTDAASANLPNLTTDEVVSRMVEANARRSSDLSGFTGTRTYNLDYRGFPGNREAHMVVAARYTAPSTKEFDIISESGSKLIQSRVLKRLLVSEKEAADAENQRRNALNTNNYKFTLLGTRPSQYGGCYRLQAEPRRENKYLFRGEICVNARDFAVESIQAEPAKSPSFWIKQTSIEHRYQKIGEFWLPAFNKSVTNVVLGGTATLTIEYTDYKLAPRRSDTEFNRRSKTIKV
jgi:hypothetical protein